MPRVYEDVAFLSNQLGWAAAAYLTQRQPVVLEKWLDTNIRSGYAIRFNTIYFQDPKEASFFALAFK